MTRESLIGPPPPPPQRIKRFLFFFPFSSWMRRKLSRPSRLSGVIFHLAFFEAAENLKGRRYSSLVSVPSPNWGRFRCGSALRPPGTLSFVLPGSHRVSRPGLKLQKPFFFSFFFLPLSQPTSHPTMQSGCRRLFFLTSSTSPQRSSSTFNSPQPPRPAPRVTTLISLAQNLAGAQSRRNHRWMRRDEWRGEEEGGGVGGVAGVKQRRADCGARGPLTERRYKTEWRCGGAGGGGAYKALYLPAGIVSLNHGGDVRHQRQQGLRGGAVGRALSSRPPVFTHLLVAVKPLVFRVFITEEEKIN